ncbi:RHS repeat protein [Pantoea ananatis]|uniref:RHS repeat protein n=1 Tax=Pantoea ananas TaxID=553 RepID=UPI0024AC981B|nr:RHS repeat domain-containing protein [Pantoea ananatis]MDI6539541.1 RHS repeat protein [Pantoea ananatis]
MTHHNTPTVAVLDNRGLTVRDIAYHRHPGSPDVTSERITRHQYDARGFLVQSTDPRLHDAGLANFTDLMDLAGNVLRSQGVDNGTMVALSDAAGRPFISVSNISTAGDGAEDRSQAVTRRWQYEDATLPGRPLSITEQTNGKGARITERFVWAGNSAEEKALNLAGACVSHYDTAGLTQTDSVALTGVPLSVTRRLLRNADNPDAVADWQGEDTSAWNDLLDGEAYTTLTTTNATGAVLTTRDAKGNLQRVAYDVAGLLSGSWLTLKGGTEQVIVVSLTYSAAGQKLREEHGNGVVTTYTYEPETQRLTGIKTERPVGHASGAKVLQDQRYEYDPVGNVLKISNDAEETRFWRNQKVVPENAYAYDSLYQLVSATGREMANAGQQGSKLPPATIPLPTDSSAYTNYTRTYSYDNAGNLTQIRHSAPATGNSYTTDITVSGKSNRGVLSTLTENPADVDALFTAGGQQRQLLPGQNLVWTPRGELLKVTPVVRDGGTDDRESYRYGSNSQRILKVSVQKTGNGTQTQRALYLPGLELRTTQNGNAETESLQVITAGESGRAQVRVLHWESGRPAEITGDQVRYSYDNLTGSSQLELDGDGNVISTEEYYPYGGTAILTARSQTEVKYKTVRYSGKERDATGLYYYGYRYYQPWAGRWLSADPASTVDGLNLFRMVRNNPVSLLDPDGQAPTTKISHATLEKEGVEAGKIIGGKIVKLNKNTTEAWIKKIKDKNNDLISKFKMSKLPIHNEDTVSKAFDFAIEGNKKKFAGAYRSANPGQDELMSTQTVFSIFSGMGQELSLGSAEHKTLAKETFRQLSLTRLPTEFSGYNYRDGMVEEIMQHPTSPLTLTYSSNGKNHGRQDLLRRAVVIDALKSELASANTDDPISAILEANIAAATHTLNNFTAPAAAENMQFQKTLTSSQIKEFTDSREAIKQLDAPDSSYRRGNQSWKKNRAKRGFSPFRKL